MKTSMVVLVISLCLACGGCHQDDVSTGAKDPGAVVTPANQPASEPTPIPTTTPAALTAEEQCRQRGDDFELVNSSCVEKANKLVAGELAITEGTIWEPTAENCTKLNKNAETGIVYYRSCLGAEVSIPLAVPASGNGETRIRINYTCKLVYDFPIEIKLGSFIATLAPKKDGSDVLNAVVPVEASFVPKLEVRFVPDYKSFPGASNINFPSTCKISLLENRLVSGT